MPTIVHLVRHGEVENPDHLVYADLPGFGLGAPGRAQAAAVADYLAERRIARLVSSPLTRAKQTAAIVGGVLGLPLEVDDRLTEWRLGTRWAGVRWNDLPSVFPGELEAYLAHPHRLPFSPESIDDVANRVTELIDQLARRHPDEETVVVSHQDPIQAARLCLTGRSLARLQHDKPDHASAITLTAGSPWREVAVWTPDGPSTLFPPIPDDPPV